MRPILPLFFSFFIVFLSCNSSIAQTHTPLVEHFTNSWCPLCADGNVYYYRKLDKYRSKINHISYYVPIPYAQCEFYQASKAGRDARMNFYDIVGTPSALIDGKMGNGPLPTDMNYMVAADKQPDYSLVFTKNSSSEVALTLTTLHDITESLSLNMYVAVIEKEIDKKTPNQEEKHFDVFRGFISSNEGNLVVIPANTKAGTQFNLSFVSNADFSQGFSKYKYIAFIQNSGTKEVLESQSAEVNNSARSHLSYQNQKLTASPNPTDGAFTLSCPDITRITGVEIYDSQGKKVFTARNPENLNFNVNLFPGIYVIKVQSTDSLVPYSTKLIIK